MAKIHSMTQRPVAPVIPETVVVAPAVAKPAMSAETLQQRAMQREKQRKALVFLRRSTWFLLKAAGILLSLVLLVVCSIVGDNRRAGRQAESFFDGERYRDGRD